MVFKIDVDFNFQEIKIAIAIAIKKHKKITYLGIIGPAQMIIILIAVFLAIILTILALIDILKSKFNVNDKIVWALVVLFFNFLGAILYFTIGRKQKQAN